jgi:hypothetical protein
MDMLKIIDLRPSVINLDWEPMVQLPSWDWTGGWRAQLVSSDGAVLETSRVGYGETSAVVRSMMDMYPMAKIVVRLTRILPLDPL